MERDFTYRVNADDRIVSVNSDWLSFARENQASHLSVKTVVGRPLSQFVTCKEMQHLYDTIIEKVRRTRRTIVIPFRCDGPTVRRFMELAISSCTDGDVQFTGRLIREEPREAVSFVDSTVDRTDEFVVMCSWCKRVEASGRWLEVELAVRRLNLFDHKEMPQITHGICGDCAERVLSEIDDAR
ncbi:MAG: hypothetical protein ABGZ35_12060 [Planctomycetaceae bacterium]